MFFLITREDKLSIPPRDFGKDLRSKIMTQLRNKVEGKATGRYGFTILVTTLLKVGDGRLYEDTGDAHFPVKYFALVFRPFKNEILPAEVKTVSKQGFFAQAGPLEIFVSTQLMPENIVYFDQSGRMPQYVS